MLDLMELLAVALRTSNNSKIVPRSRAVLQRTGVEEAL